MKLLQFPDVNLDLSLAALVVTFRVLGVLCLASCGAPTWQGGIHAHLAWSHEGVRVVEVPAQSPAERAGLKDGDRLLSIDGKSVAGLTGEAVHALLSGEVGSIVSVEVLRGAERVTLAITREPYETRKAVGF